MRNTAVFVLVAVFLISCGGATTDKNEVEFTLPATVNVVQVMEGNQLQIRIEKDGNDRTVLLSPDARIYYNDKLVEQESINKGQTLYIEGESKDGILLVDKAIITVWPGKEQDRKGPAIQIDPKNVPGLIARYLEKRHPLLGISANMVWQFKKPAVPPPPSRIVDMYTFGEYLLVVSYDLEGPRQFNVLLTKGVEAPASWSGVIREDGEIIEGVYDGP